MMLELLALMFHAATVLATHTAPSWKSSVLPLVLNWLDQGTGPVSYDASRCIQHGGGSG